MWPKYYIFFESTKESGILAPVGTQHAGKEPLLFGSENYHPIKIGCFPVRSTCDLHSYGPIIDHVIYKDLIYGL
jgi:hypothetical protein